MVPNYKKPQNIRDLATRLADLGYWPVPIPAGCKGPVVDNWQSLRLNFETIPDYFTERGMLVGVLHVNVLALDIDVYDEELSQAIVAEATRRFPGALERIGEWPKSALFLRMEEPGFKVRATKKRERDGKKAQVDVRSVTRQIVAYGKHPATGKPYTWPRGELWETPRGDLPEATQDEIERFRDWCEDRISKWAGVTDPKVTDIGLYPRNAPSDDDKNEAQFLEALQHIPASVGYDDWLSALMGIHDFYEGSAHGLEVAQSWSSDYPHYDPKEVEQKWRSFEAGKGVTYRSIFALARQNGADLSAIARAHTPSQTATARELAEGFEAASTTSAPEAFNPAAAAQPAEGELEWFDDVEPSLVDEYVIKGVLSQGAMSVVYGPSNSGKTFFALDIAFHAAIGAPWRDRRVQQAGVLYLAAEGGRGVKNRIVALKKTFGVAEVPMAIRRAGLDLLQQNADIEHVVKLAAEVQKRAVDMPLVIVVDTLSRVMAGGDENSAADMTALIRNIDIIREATGAHIMLVHHTGKDVAKGARGHSSLRAATDTEVEVQTTEGEEGEQVRAAFVAKQRDYQGGEYFAFHLKSVPLGIDQDGDEVSSCVVESADADDFQSAAKAKKGLGGNQKVVAETFDQMVAEGLGKPNPAGVGLPEAGQFWAVEMDELRRHCQGKFAGSNPREAWRTAWTGVSEKRGLFCAASGLVWRIDRRVKG